MAGQPRPYDPRHGAPPGSDELETDKLPNRSYPAGNPQVAATQKVDPMARPSLSAISLPEIRRPQPATRTETRAPILPWAFMVAVVLGAGFGIYYVYQKYEIAQDELAEANAAASVAHQRAAAADSKLMELDAELSRARGEFAAARKRAGQRDGTGLEAKLEQLIPDGRGELVFGSDGRLNLALDEAAVFVPGTDRLSEDGSALLGRLGEVLAGSPDEQVWVYSHATAGESAKAASTLSWELSSRRALAAVYYLQDRASIDPGRLAIVAFGAPRAGPRRAASRTARIEFVLFPRNAR